LSPWSIFQSRGTFRHNSHRPKTLRAYRPAFTDRLPLTTDRPWAQPQT
jgi:hypothetical protein